MSASDTKPSSGTRTKAGSTYGDWVPPRVRGKPLANPARGAELEQAALPDDADFSKSLRSDEGTVDPLPRTEATPSNPKSE